jgi:hypothetical protein
MPDRVYEGSRAKPAPAPRRSTDQQLLRLQGRIGNRAVQRLLQRDTDDFAPVKDLSKGKFGNWSARPSGANDPDLLQDLVVLAGADVVKSVADSKGAVNRMGGMDDVKPGLNFFARLPGQGMTGYIDAAGKFTPTLPVTKTNVPQVAIILGGQAFDQDRTYALSTLRHEMRHAIHFENTIKLLKTWQSSGGRKDFNTWLGSQRLSGVDTALVNERIAGTRLNTETLGWMEGVITGLPFLSAAPTLANVLPHYPPAIAELLGAGQFYAQTNTAPDVKKSALAHLQSYCCDQLTAQQRQAFAAWVAFLRERSGAQPPAHTKPTNEQLAADRVFNDFNTLSDFLQDVLKAVTTPCPKVVSHARDLTGQLGKGKDITADVHALPDVDLRELDVAAAADAKGRPLRQKIAAELFSRHKPSGLKDHGDIKVTKSGKSERKDHVDGGEVEIQTGVSVTAPGGNSSSEAFSATYRPAKAMAGEQWLQLTWREFFTELPAKRGGKPQKDTRGGVLEWSGFPYQFTTDPQNPHWNTDSGSRTDAFNDEIRDRSATELTMFDWPSSNVSELAPLFGDPLKHPTKGTSHFHQDVFLIRGAEIIYHAAIDEQWEIASASAKPSLTVAVHGPLANSLSPAQRARLISQYPEVGYLRDFGS